ncbi:MAG: MobC family plasmid mobilization relaxosome protein [Acidaminococcus sp.]|jgi:hypothetical protein|nr:MobC family plasmid mobilization relaxosome protein [Acidaminococcus sp.]
MKDIRIYTRVSEKEYERIKTFAAITNKRIADFIRTRALVPFNEIENLYTTTIDELRRIGVNLNQAVKKMNQAGCQQEDVEKVLKYISEIECWQSKLMETIKENDKELHAAYKELIQQQKELETLLNEGIELGYLKKNSKLVRFLSKETKLRRRKNGNSKSIIEQKGSNGYTEVSASGK